MNKKNNSGSTPLFLILHVSVFFFVDPSYLEAKWTYNNYIIYWSTFCQELISGLITALQVYSMHLDYN